jgi:hypothetical protein
MCLLHAQCCLILHMLVWAQDTQVPSTLPCPACCFSLQHVLLNPNRGEVDKINDYTAMCLFVSRCPSSFLP